MAKIRRRRVALFMVYLLALVLASLYGVVVMLDYDTAALSVHTLLASADPCAYACREARREPLQMRMLEQSGEPIAYVVGSSQGAKTIQPQQCVCVRAVVPAEPARASNQTDYKPVPGWPTDSLMVDLVMQSSKNDDGVNDPLYADARVTVSVNMRDVTRNSDYARSHVYEGAAQLFDPGLYALDARIEFRNGQWNANPGLHTPDYKETPMRNTLPGNPLVPSQVHVLYDPRHATYLGRHQNLPLCTNGAAPGRWIPERNLPPTWKTWQYMSPAEDGRVWLPYACRLRRISHAEFVFHMSRRWPSVHWYGDSNSRRTLRPFVMGGKWCYEANSTARLDCLCNDAPKDLFPSEWYPGMPVPHWYRVHTNGVHSTEIHADLRRLLQEPTDPRPILDKDPSDDGNFGPAHVPPGYRLRDDYFDLYYRFTRGTLDIYGSHWERDITSAAVAPYQPASLVVVQLITWDAAFGSFARFKIDVERLANRLRTVYPRAEFVYRSGPYWCCRNSDDQGKKYSRLRFQSFDAYARNVFQRKLRARVWDVMSPPGQRPPESKRLSENMPCRSAHSRAEHIHLDNQVFMNMLVNGQE